MFEGIFKSERALARHRDAPLAEERVRYIQHCIERGSTPLTIELKCRELLWAARLIRDEHGLAFNKKSLHALATQRAAGQKGDPSQIQERFENKSEMTYLEATGRGGNSYRISFSQWWGLFSRRTVWGLMLGFGGINYTVWLYMSWMPNYLEAEHHVSVAKTGMIAVIPFSCGAVGMLLSGIIADFLVRSGIPADQEPQNFARHWDDVFCRVHITGPVCSRRDRCSDWYRNGAFLYLPRGKLRLGTGSVYRASRNCRFRGNNPKLWQLRMCFYRASYHGLAARSNTLVPSHLGDLLHGVNSWRAFLPSDREGPHSHH